MKKAIGLCLLLLWFVSCTSISPLPSPTLIETIKSSALPTTVQAPTSEPLPTVTPTQTEVSTPPSALTALPGANPIPKRLAQIGGSICGITVVGDLAYVGIGPRIGVIDISDHASPRLVSQTKPLPGLVTHLILISARLLIVSAGKYLALMDSSNPEGLKIIQQIDLNGGISALVFDGQRNILYAGGAIYTAPGSLGFDGFISSVDINPAAKLRLIDSVTMPEIPVSIALGKGSLFAGANGEEGGLYYIQVKSSGKFSVPQQVIVSTPESPLVPTSMQVIGERLYLGYWGVVAYDITDPRQPKKVWSGSVAGINITTDFVIYGDQVYMTGFSIREPEIQLVGAEAQPEPVEGNPLGKVASITALHEGYFLVADKILKIFATANLKDLSLVGSYQVPLINAVDGVANESSVFAVDNGVGDGLSNSILWVFSLPDLKQLGQVTTEFPNSWGEGFRDIALAGDRVYLAAREFIWIYGINSPQPLVLGKIEIDEGEIGAIAALDDGADRLLFVARSIGEENVIMVYDLTDVNKPTEFSNALALGQGMGLEMDLDGSRLYVLLEYTRYSSPNISTLYSIGYGNGSLRMNASLELAGYFNNLDADTNLVALVGTDTALNRPTISVIQTIPLKLLSTQALPEDGMGVIVVGETTLDVVGGSWDFGGEAELLSFDLQSALEPRQGVALPLPFSDNSSVSMWLSPPYVILANGSGGVEVLDYRP